MFSDQISTGHPSPILRGQGKGRGQIVRPGWTIAIKDRIDQLVVGVGRM